MFVLRKHIISTMLAAILALTVVLFGGSRGQSIAHAATNDPLVVVAIGTILPSSACKDTVTIDAGTSHVSTQTRPCEELPIQMGTEHVHLSEALAKHEAYVVIPAKNSSQATLEQAMSQIVDLMHAKTQALRQSLRKNPLAVAQPDSTCETNSHLTDVDWYGNNDYFESEVTWTESSNCSTLFIDNDILGGITSDTASYWRYDKYASMTKFPGCVFLGTNYWQMTIDSTEPAGYYYEPWVSNGSACQPWDGNWYVNIALS